MGRKEGNRLYEKSLNPNSRYKISSENREYLDKILPKFQFDKLINIPTVIQQILNVDSPTNYQIDRHSISKEIGDFLYRHDFLSTPFPDSVVNRKGMDLADCGSLQSYEENENKFVMELSPKVENHYHAPITTVTGSGNFVGNQDFLKNSTIHQDLGVLVESTAKAIQATDTISTTSPTVVPDSWFKKCLNWFKSNIGKILISVSASIIFYLIKSYYFKDAK